MLTESQLAARKLWVEALRSGQYKQCRGALCKETSSGFAYCCLGVATQLYCDNVENIKSDKERYSDIIYFKSEIGGDVYDEGGILPTKVRNWIGVTNCGRLKDEIDGLETLTLLNDKAELNFNQIADIIEQGLLEDAN